MTTTATEERKKSYETYICTGLALDPVHVGTGGTWLGRVDNTIVRDPVTQIPKIPGSSLAGVIRTYAAMNLENTRKADKRDKPYYPDCAGQGGGDTGHCGQANCPICTVFGFAKGKDESGGFAGLAGFSDMHVLLFPVATSQGPKWVTSPIALYQIGLNVEAPEQENIYCNQANGHLNLGWLYLKTNKLEKVNEIVEKLKELKVDQYLRDRLCIVSDKLFTHIVNSNLEVRTSVAIDPAIGAAKEGALFTYEALPRGTVMVWEVICRNPSHFGIKDKEKHQDIQDINAVASIEEVCDVVRNADKYLEHLGIGGMGSRGMGRLEVLGYFPEEVKEAK